MVANSKNTAMSKEKDRRKSGGKASSTVTLKMSADKLRKIVDPSSVKETSPVKSSPAPIVAAVSETPAPAASQDDNANSSSPGGTPAAIGTPSQTPMGPPVDGLKKKGVKRSSTAANGNDPTAKIRGKPGPKKRARLEDGTIDPNGRAGGNTYHKLGPKANQGAINAGLRALDRSGAPCRKWTKGGFKLKSFTGVLWEIPRWTAPQKQKSETASEEATVASAESSNKENKDGSQMKSENSASNAEGEQRSAAPSVNPSSPAPVPIAAA
ncbi:DUF1711-domain-containing protein [Xylariaceae sp. FL1019]|nr:DUF1711-domain-containing protein [Xylariaceae sp. FL1019]